MTPNVANGAELVTDLVLMAYLSVTGILSLQVVGDCGSMLSHGCLAGARSVYWQVATAAAA